MSTLVCVPRPTSVKLREIKAILADLPIVIRGLEKGEVDFPEEGDDYTANALQKARTVSQQLGKAAVADDSGLEVDALDGAPGVFSARYGGRGSIRSSKDEASISCS